MKYIVALDSFKGCLTSIEASNTLAESLRKKGCAAECVPVSDGGDGMIDALAYSLKGWTRIDCRVHDALMRSCYASYLLKDQQAIIESAQACGLISLKDESLRPLLATSYGVGELLMHAINNGARNILVGLGGTATSDSGLGMLKGFKEAFLRSHGISDPQFKTWNDIRPALDSLQLKITLASDVTNPLYGPQGAAATFGHQKGATDDDIKLLDRRARSFASMSARYFGFDCSFKPGAGAAGGLGYAFMQYLNADMQSGAELVLKLIKFDNLLSQSPCLVITGEGKADRQTLMGKIPYIIMQHCKRKSIKCILLAGKVENLEELKQSGFDDVKCINPALMSEEDSMNPSTAKRMLSLAINPCE